MLCMAARLKPILFQEEDMSLVPVREKELMTVSGGYSAGDEYTASDLWSRYTAGDSYQPPARTRAGSATNLRLTAYP